VVGWPATDQWGRPDDTRPVLFTCEPTRTKPQCSALPVRNPRAVGGRMSFVAQCIFCKHKVKAPDEALGASVRCKKCDNSFTLAPIEKAPSEQVLTRFRRHAPAAACGATDVAAPGTGLVTAQGPTPSPSHNGPADHAVAQEIPDP